MTRFTRAALAAAWLAALATPALAQSAPMGAPSDAAPPAPLYTTQVSDSMAAKDVRAARIRARRAHHRHVAVHNTKRA